MARRRISDSDQVPKQPGIEVTRSTWPEVDAALKRGATGVLTVGAASKQHGPHLPMDTDRHQAQWLGRALTRRLPVVVWPTLTYGYYPAFTAYPGSISLSSGTFMGLLDDVIHGIHASGARRLLVVNTGVSTREGIEESAARASLPVRICHVYEGPRFLRLKAELERQARGGHADEIETSIMLAMAPKRVRMARAVACAERDFVAGPFNPLDPLSPNYTPSGVYGDPTLASREKGRRLLDAMLQDLEKAVQGQFSVPRPGGDGE